MTYRVIVCGSRKWHDRKRIEDRLSELPDPSSVVIVVGYNPEKDTPKGADRLAYQEAQKAGLLVEPHPAEWDRYGKPGSRKNPAGLIRNEEMAKLGADLCIAFLRLDVASSGTRHMIDRAKSYGIPVEIITEQTPKPFRVIYKDMPDR